MRLNICTPLSRLSNVIALTKSMTPLLESEKVDVQWWAVLDQWAAGVVVETGGSPKVHTLIGDTYKALAGHAHRNQVLDRLMFSSGDEWFMSLDDDNIIHPNFLKFIESFVENNNKYRFRGIIFDQVYKDGSLRLRADPHKVHVGNVDTAQYLFSTKLLFYTDHDYIRFDETRYDADGVLIEEMYKNHVEDFLIVNEPLCYYNYLR